MRFISRVRIVIICLSLLMLAGTAGAFPSDYIGYFDFTTGSGSTVTNANTTNGINVNLYGGYDWINGGLRTDGIDGYGIWNYSASSVDNWTIYVNMTIEQQATDQKGILEWGDVLNSANAYFYWAQYTGGANLQNEYFNGYGTAHLLDGTNNNYTFIYNGSLHVFKNGTFIQTIANAEANKAGAASIFLGNGYLGYSNVTFYKFVYFDSAKNASDMVETEASFSTTPNTPSWVSNTIGADYINHTWQSSGTVITDSYNVSHNDVWDNGTTNVSLNSTGMSQGNWSNITVWAWNNTGSGNLSATGLSNNSQIPIVYVFNCTQIGSDGIDDGIILVGTASNCTTTGTNDDIVINYALNNSTSGDTVLLQDGNYGIGNGTIWINNSDITFKGSSKAGTILTATNASLTSQISIYNNNISAVYSDIRAASPNVEYDMNLTVSDFTLNGVNTASTDGKYNYGLVGVIASNITIRNISIATFYRDLAITGSHEIIAPFQDAYIHDTNIYDSDFGINGEGDIYLQYSNRGNISRNNILNAGTVAFQLNSANTNYTVSDNTLSGSNVGIYIYSASNDNVLDNNTISVVNSGIRNFGGLRNMFSNNTLKNGKTGGGTGYAFEITFQTPGQTGTIFKNNIIYDNMYGFYIHSQNENSDWHILSLENNVVFNNSQDGIFTDISHNNVTLKNNIIINNSKYGINKTVAGANITSTYSDVWNNTLGNYSGLSAGIGDISVDPLFVSLTDFHLQGNQTWNDTTLSWDTYGMNSPAIGAGDPTSDNSLSPWGGIIEMGAYGNTIYASQGATESDYIPPNATDLVQVNASGNGFWINQSWQLGTENSNITDSYVIQINGSYDNSSNNYSNTTVPPHGYKNITVWAYNSSGNGTLSNASISLNTQIQNNPPIQTAIGDQSVNESVLLTITITSTDADGDPLTYGTNASKGSLVDNTFTWTPTYNDSGTYIWYFNTTDNLSAVDTETITITVNDMTPTPPEPTSLTSNTGNYYVNYTWQPGSGNITDSYNVSQNSTWVNGTILTYNNSSVGASGWSNITVCAYNNSGIGYLSPCVSQNTQAPASFTPSNNIIYCPTGWCQLAQNRTNYTLLQLDSLFTTDIVQGWYNATSQKFESHSKYSSNQDANVTIKSGYYYYFSTPTTVYVNITSNPSISLLTGWNLVGNMDTNRTLSELKTSIGGTVVTASHWNFTSQQYLNDDAEIVPVGEAFMVNVNSNSSWSG